MKSATRVMIFSRLVVYSMAAICIMLLVGDVPVHSADATSSIEQAAAATTQRQREGMTLTDVAGYFKMSGDRATFYPSDGGKSYAGLENLNLERITALVSENPRQIEWIVSGTLTEFRGSNYLLISKAVMKTRGESAEAAQPRPSVPRSQAAPGKRGGSRATERKTPDR